jgi:hypothetical protein
MTEREFQFEEQLKNFRGNSRLQQLYSYYYTWKFPNHPENKQLYEVMLKLIDLRNKICVGLNTQRFELSYDNDLTAKSIEAKFRELDQLSNDDKKIVEHCLAHCHILGEIEILLANS